LGNLSPQPLVTNYVEFMNLLLSHLVRSSLLSSRFWSIYSTPNFRKLLAYSIIVIQIFWNRFIAFASSSTLCQPQGPSLTGFPQKLGQSQQPSFSLSFFFFIITAKRLFPCFTQTRFCAKPGPYISCRRSVQLYFCVVSISHNALSVGFGQPTSGLSFKPGGIFSQFLTFGKLGSFPFFEKPPLVQLQLWTPFPRLTLRFWLFFLSSRK
jgi:hypothetical protein